MKKLAAFLFVVALSALAVPRARGQADLSFSGGSGAPLFLTLDVPVTYVITTANNASLAFVFQGTGNILNTNQQAITGSITFTVNNGAPITLNTLQSGVPFGSVTAMDAITISNATTNLLVGDRVRLLAGTEKTSGNVTASPAASGAFQTFIVNGAGVKLDAVNGVPEPSTWAMLSLGVVGAGLTVMRRRQRVA